MQQLTMENIKCVYSGIKGIHYSAFRALEGKYLAHILSLTHLLAKSFNQSLTHSLSYSPTQSSILSISDTSS